MSEKIVFVSHCILNQGIRNKKLSKVKGLLELLAEADVGLAQLPCPKLECDGNFGNENKFNVKTYKEYCKRFSISLLNTIKNYLDSNFKVVGILGVDFSPICGVHKINNGKKNVPGKGILIKEIEKEMEKRSFQIPIISTDLNNPFSTLEKVDLLLKNY